MNYETQQMVSLNFTNPIGSPSGRRSPEGWDLKILVDYNKAMVYLVHGDRPDQCTAYPFQETLFRCIPDDAVYLTNGYLGSPGSTLLTYDVWRYRTPMVSQGAAAANGSQEVVTTLSISHDCVPIMEGVHEPADPAMDLVYMASNFKRGLKDPGPSGSPAAASKSSELRHPHCGHVACCPPWRHTRNSQVL